MNFCWYIHQTTGNYNDGVKYETNPILRDTATVESNSYIVLRFVANNPGVWVVC